MNNQVQAFINGETTELRIANQKPTISNDKTKVYCLFVNGK